MSARRADTILLGGRVWTASRCSLPATALAISGDRIAAVGNDDDVRGLAGSGTACLDLAGAVVVPGLHDAHLHLAAGSCERSRLDLRDAAGAEEAAFRVRERARSLREGSWLRGHGWDQTRWDRPEFPSRRLLDEAAPRHPVFLSRVDGHAAWLNTVALRRLGISRSTPDPPGGSIVREQGTGEPSGILLERAMEEALDRLPGEGEEERRRGLLEALRELARYGITSVEDVAPSWAVPIYARLAEEGELSVRVSVWLPVAHDRKQAAEWRERYPAGHPWLSVATLKVFLDGTLGSRTAALLAPYADEPPSRGILRMEPAELAETVWRADTEGWAVAVHAIGDRAVRVALDALERLPPRARPKPHRIEHAQLVAREDLGRFARVGAVASVQPVHLVEDLGWLASRLGDRAGSVPYPWRSLSSAGASLVFGSDWPVASLDPRRSLHAAVSRALPGREEEPYGAEERLPVEQALLAHTAAAAVAAGRGRALGVLRPGALADFLLLDRDPRRVAAGELLVLSVRETWVGGRRVHPVEAGTTRLI